jgi:Arc/MetJ-type ribon-helix-helix transcriptional regulator
MPKKAGTNGKTTQISLTLPAQVAEMLQDLVGVGLYGASRSEVARTLILGRLEQLAAQNIVQLKRQPG